MRITADRDVCIGAGNCLLTAPGVFEQDDDGLVVLLTPDVASDQADAVRRAVTRCPSGALSVAGD